MNHSNSSLPTLRWPPPRRDQVLGDRVSRVVRASTLFLVSFALLPPAVAPNQAHADLTLDIPERSVTPGESGWFDVTVETTPTDLTVGAWETELVVDAEAELIRFLDVQLASSSPVNQGIDFNVVTIEDHRVQVQGVAKAVAPSLTADEPPMPLYRVNYQIDNDAPDGSVIVINFSGENFTNFLDGSLSQVIVPTRSGGLLTVSSVPEPAAWMGFAVLTAGTLARRQRRRGRTAT